MSLDALYDALEIDSVSRSWRDAVQANGEARTAHDKAKAAARKRKGAR